MRLPASRGAVLTHRRACPHSSGLKWTRIARDLSKRPTQIRPRACHMTEPSPPRIYIQTADHASIPYFRGPPIAAGGRAGLYVLEHLSVEAGSLAAHTFDADVLMLPLGSRIVRFHSRLNGRRVSGLIAPEHFRFLARGDTLSTCWSAPLQGLFLALTPALMIGALGDVIDGRSMELVSKYPAASGSAPLPPPEVYRDLRRRPPRRRTPVRAVATGRHSDSRPDSLLFGSTSARFDTVAAPMEAHAPRRIHQSTSRPGVASEGACRSRRAQSVPSCASLQGRDRS